MDDKKTSNLTIHYLLILLAGSLWGTIGLFVKLLDARCSSSEYTSFLRMLFAFLLLFLITIIKDGIKAFRISRRMLISCMLLGFVSMSLNNLCYTRAVSSLGMSLAAAILYLAPLFTSIESKLLFNEQIGRRKITALLLNVAGCVLAATGGDFTHIQFSAAGVLFGLGAALAYSTQNIFGRIATDEGSPFVVATYNFFFATIFILVVTRPWTTVSRPADPGILLYGFLFGLIPTTIAYLLYFAGIQGLKESSKVPVLCSMELVIATVLGITVYREPLSLIAVAGIAVILLSIVMMNRRI